jgi:hypothetical protein
VIAIYVSLTVAALILATAGWSDPFEGINVDTGTVGDIARAVVVIAALAEIVALLLSVVSLVFRYRRSTGAERLQLKWFVSAAAIAAVAFSVGFFIDSALVSAIVSTSVAFLYVAIGIAMLKHNLYDIDLILNKTITYGALAAFITAIYVIVVVVIGALIGVTEGVSLIATAVVAVAFQPIRRQAQQIANRLCTGAGDALRGPVPVLRAGRRDLLGEDVLVRMARLLAEGTGATSAVVWLRVGDEVRPAATWPTNGAMATAIPSWPTEPPRRRGARPRRCPSGTSGSSSDCSP